VSSSTDSTYDFAAPVVPADRLQFASTAWIRRMSWGALAAALAVPAHIVGAFVMARLDAPLGGSVVHALSAGLTVAGVWLMTAADGPGRQKHLLLALGARWLALAACVMWIGAVVAAWREGVMVWLVVPALVCMGGEAIALGLYACRLAGRIPHEGLANQFRYFALFLPVFLGFLVICQFYGIKPEDGYFFIVFPLLGALVGLMAWVAATWIRLFWELRQTMEAAEDVVQKRLQAVEAAARAAAKAARPRGGAG
jgi:hypothetical protein